MKKNVYLFILIFGCSTPNVELTDSIDPDIVIINIEEGDRTFIGNLITKIDSCNPKVIGIDAWFINEKDDYQDSILIQALSTTNKEVLGYTYNPRERKYVRSHEKFRKESSKEGLCIVYPTNGIATHFIPFITYENEILTHFSFEIASLMNPELSLEIEPDKKIPIQFTRTLDLFKTIQGSEFSPIVHHDSIENKVVLLSYIGPTNEDKHFTPMRFELGTSNDQPDTYGIVIIANEIRTLLDLNKDS